MARAPNLRVKSWREAADAALLVPETWAALAPKLALRDAFVRFGGGVWARRYWCLGIPSLQRGRPVCGWVISPVRTLALINRRPRVFVSAEYETVYVRSYDAAGERVWHIGVPPAAFSDEFLGGLGWLWSNTRRRTAK